MFVTHQNNQWRLYQKCRKILVDDPNRLIALEKFFAKVLQDFVAKNIQSITKDYNEASYLYSFWKNYPPEDRGRQPKHDQYPWIEVGEQVIGPKLTRYLSSRFSVRDVGLPSGSDNRYLLSSNEIKDILGFSYSAWLFVDIKSVGPRDNAMHAVMSNYQISGSGDWNITQEGMKNKPIQAIGQLKSHPFYCSLSPLYVLSDGTVAPSVTAVLKPLYKMLSLSNLEKGQPLEKITTVLIPNGLLLCVNPNLTVQYPGLFFPGKDDKSKDPRKMRARISFDLLSNINPWRVHETLTS